MLEPEGAGEHGRTLSAVHRASVCVAEAQLKPSVVEPVGRAHDEEVMIPKTNLTEMDYKSVTSQRDQLKIHEVSERHSGAWV